ncbi:hypothetical protein VTK26DRAFT_8570 [Humicola hyalothermophila]
MAPPSGKQPTNKGTGQTTADMDEEEKRKLAAMQGMMDDLGIGRLNDLPLDNERRESDRGHHQRGAGQGQRGRGNRGHGGDGFGNRDYSGQGNYTWTNANFNNRGQRVSGRGPISHEIKVHAPRSQVPQKPGLAELWTAAIGSGAFNDEDAAAVRGLDDLGGGRIYDKGGRRNTANVARQVADTKLDVGDGSGHGGHGRTQAMAASAASQKQKAMDKTMKILEYESKRSHWAAPNQTHSTESKNAPRRNNPPAVGHSLARSQPPSQPLASVNRSSISSVKTHPQPQATGSAEPAKPPQTRSFEEEDEPIDPLEAGERLDKLLQMEACGRPDNTVLKASVNFSNRDINPGLPAFVFLSSAEQPRLGLFSIVICGRMFCQWPISAWHSYAEGEGNLLRARFTPRQVPSPKPIPEDAITVANLPKSETCRGSHPVKFHNAKEDTRNDARSSASSLPLSREQVIRLCRQLLNVFILNSGKKHMVDGIRSGVLAYVLQDAKLQGYNAKQLQELEALIHGALGCSPLASAGTASRRIQYTADELLSMRHVATKPPTGFADIVSQHLLARTSRSNSLASRTGEVSPRAPENGIQTNGPKLEFAASASAMRWVLGQDEPPKSDQSSTRAPAPNAVPRGATKTLGLSNSRWASEGDEIRHANYFTGPAYEKAWPKRSHLAELAKLNPQATVTVGTEDLMDFYFPTSSHEITRAQPVVTVDSASDTNGAVQLDSAADTSGAVKPDSIADTNPAAKPKPRAAPTVDNIENLSISMSRLSLSPDAAPFEPAVRSSPSIQSSEAGSVRVPRQVPADMADAAAFVQPAKPPVSGGGLRGLGASRHSGGNGPSTSGKFNFCKPGQE